jgi:zinc protease
VRIMLGEFARMGSEPLDDDLLSRRKAYLAGGHARDLESSSGYADALVDLLAQGVDPAQVANYSASLDAVTAGQASAAAARYFDPDMISLVVVGNAAAFIDELRSIRPDVEVIPAQGIDLLSL